MYELHITEHLPIAWSNVRSIYVGDRASHDASLYILVEYQGLPLVRIDASLTNHSGAFCKAIVWKQFVIVGCNDSAFFIEPSSGSKHLFECEGYFAGLYPSDELVLVASASELICVDENASLLWRCSNLAVDGVRVNQLEDGVVYGEGEWDPPGGWRKFRLSMADGCTLECE